MSPQPQPTRVLFTGHAPVHFLCFRPLFEALRNDPAFEVFVSGGFRQQIAKGQYLYDPLALFPQLGVPTKNILAVEDMQQQDFDVLFCSNTKMLEPRSVAKKVQVFHGISFRNRAIRPANMGADHYLMVGPYMSRKFEEAGLMKVGDPRQVQVGLLKSDALLDGRLQRSALLDLFGFDGTRPVIAFCPTGQRYNALDQYGLALLHDLQDTGRYDILVKLHDHPHGSKDWSEDIADLQGPHLKIVETYDVMPVLAASDLLITDASSVSNEYVLLDRPIIYMDVPKLIEAAMGKEDSMTDLATWGRRTGTVVSSAAALPGAVMEALARPDALSHVRQESAADLFYNPGKAVAAAMSWIHANLVPCTETQSA